MSLIIKGMDMPYCCVVCPFKEMYNDGLLCKATKPHQYIPKFLHKRNEKCPLTEIPTPHGDLIDKESIKKFILDGINKPAPESFGYDGIEILAEIEFAPAIIEAEVN